MAMIDLLNQPIDTFSALEKAVNELEDDECACLLRAIFHYISTGDVMELQSPEKFVFEMFRMALLLELNDDNEKEGEPYLVH